jgi:hypothetical protein
MWASSAISSQCRHSICLLASKNFTSQEAPKALTLAHSRPAPSAACTKEHRANFREACRHFAPEQVQNTTI